MPASLIETVLIFFVLFFVSSSIITFFLSTQNYFFQKIDREILYIDTNTLKLCISSVSENSTIFCEFPEEINVYGNLDRVVVSYKNLHTRINIKKVKGIGIQKFYVYNHNGTYYII